MKHYELEISQFVDNELPVDEQKKFFVHLSNCEECGRTLSDFMRIKKESKLFYNGMDVDFKRSIKLPETILPKKEKNIYKALFYFSVAASIVLGILFLLQQLDGNKIGTKYSILEAKYTALSKNYFDVLKDKAKNFNALLTTNAETPSKKYILKKTKSVKSSTGNNFLAATDKKIKLSNKNRNFSSIQVVKITKSDFLTPQIVGN